MRNHGCINGTLEGANYASPMPLIGLYIGAASLVCMLMMLYDLVSGIRARHRWIPCKSFTLNSVTLTLLSIVAKLPVDLTTPMPSPIDQLSKLSGTTMVCICIGFLLPSIGVNTESECFTNTVAMSIFVITVVINICIQLSTGVIVLFVAEHIVILCFMLLLLMMLWYTSWDINNRKRISIDRNKGILTKGNGSMLERLKASYLFGYCSNPQLVLCLNPMSVVCGIICPISSFLLIHATLKSLILKQMKFCAGVSDYDWSMWAIVFTQILTALVGSLAMMIRWLALSRHREFDYMSEFLDQKAEKIIDKNPILGTVSTFDKHWKNFRNVYLTAVTIMESIILFVPTFIISIIWAFDVYNSTSPEEWTARKSMEDMNRLMDASKRKPQNSLFQLLSRTCPSQQLHNMELKDQADPKKGIKVSSLSLVLLVRIVQVSFAGRLSAASLIQSLSAASLIQTYKEGKEIIHFIDATITPKSLENDNKLLFAKAVWEGSDFCCLHKKIFNVQDHPHSELNLAIWIMKRVKDVLPSDVVSDELGIIVDYISSRTYSSIDDLYQFIEQMFVNMLHGLLAQVPNAIFKILNDSAAEEYEGKVKLALELIFQIESIGTQIQWSFPAGCNMPRLTSIVRAAENNV